MKNIIALFGIGLLTLVFYSCKSNPVDQQINFNNFTWKADTLDYPGSMQTLMYSIWGSSAENIYTCGHNDQGHGQLWYFGGSKWTEKYLYDDVPTLGPTEFQRLFGFASNEIWAGGSRLYVHTGPHPGQSALYPTPKIIRFNGSKWIDEKSDTDTSTIYDIHGTDRNNLWACGSSGVLYKYSSGNWNKVQIFNDINRQKKIQFNCVKTDGNNIFLFGERSIYSSADYWEYFIILNNNKINYIDSFRVNSSTTVYNWGYKVYLSESGRLYSAGYGGIYEWTNNKWEKIYQCYYYIQDMKEINGMLIAVGSSGAIIYNNGTNWTQLNTPFDNYNTTYMGIWSDGKKIFIIGDITGTYPQKTIVLKGE